MVKIDIISGFLGAGKTTLIKKLFESSLKDEQVVIIENEFGEIGIDGGFLKDSGVKIKEINAGCICCSLVGDFATSIKEVLSTYNPDRIIIEPSGVGKLSDIINAIKNVGLAELQLNILATVVDGLKTKIYIKNFGEFFLNQVQSADTIVISKTDKMTEKQIDEVVTLIKQKNDHANIITTPITSLNSDLLLKTLQEKASLEHELLKQALKEHDEHDECCCHHHHHEDEECECHHHHHHEDEECECHHHHHHEDEECECHHHHHHDEEECECHHHDENHHHHHHHDADEVFTSWGTQTAKAISKTELEIFLSSLNNEDLGIVIRCKGILKASDNDKWYYFDYVSGDYDIRLGEADYTGRIVVIGSKIDEDKISNLFFGNK